MKKIVIISIIIFSVINLFAENDTTKVKSEIKKATVYLDGAQVTQTASVKLTKGVQTLNFYDLCSEASESSIQVGIEPDVKILAVVFQTNFIDEAEQKQSIKDLEKQKKNIADSISLIQSLSTVYTQEEAMILANKSIGSTTQGVDVTELSATADFYRKRLTEIKLKQLEFNNLVLSLNTRLTTVINQLNSLNAKEKQATGEILVTVNSEKIQTVEFTLSFLVTSAGWTPSYDLRAKNVSSPIELTYKADVYQNTGFDWKNIGLTLSTGEPFKSNTKPELSTWYLEGMDYNLFKTYTQKGIVGNLENEKKISSGTDFGNATNNFNFVQNTTTFNIEIDIPYTIPSDGQNHSVEVEEYTINSEYQYTVIPKLDEDAFLIAKIIDWEQYNLLSGNINLFFEGTFVGQSYLNSNLPVDTLEISLGRDKNVVVKRTKIKEYCKSQFIGDKKSETAAFEIEIRNNKSEDINLLIKDQIPVSSNKEINVDIQETSEAEYNVTTGILEWKYNLKPSESKKIILKYLVKYPKNQVIVLE
jgi:uncharacterized protein (TIGR02231 family)